MKPIKILPLGASGSGKTVYLASLFEKLALKHPDTCFSLHTDAQSGKELAIQYNKIKNLTTGWPAGTKGYQWKNFKFDCIVASKHGDHKIMALEYLEFPGGVLTDPSNLTEEQQKRLDESDVFLILIDGVQIFRLLEKVSSDSSFEDEMKILLNPIGCQLGKPLHFVVTKWDIVEKKYTLDDVVKFLNGIDCFASVMEQRRNLDLDTRLIPVSAVGKGFAQLLDDGQMVKLPNAKANR
jgi:hypothetical protein